MDETSFRNFYDKTAPALRSYLRMLCKDSALADDLLQEGYLRFLRTGASNLNEFQLKAYLYKSANSAAQDYWRAERREKRRVEESSPGVRPGPDGNLSQDMDRLFKRLNGQQQTLLWLAYIEGFNHNEIADILKLRPGSIRVLLLRARREFAEILTAEGLGRRGQL